MLVKNIKNVIHNSSEFIIINVFINKHIIKNNKKQLIIKRFSIEIYIVDDFKINLLLSSNVFETQKAVVNINIQTTTLINCENLIVFINIIAKKKRRSITYNKNQNEFSRVD